MHLITALAAGIKGAENGTAELYSRGTSTRATFYNDFEGTSSDSTGSDITLDANGGATVYVLEYVTVIVKSSSGTTVRTFTDGVSASATEVISDSFTGVDYTSGASAVSKPIALNPVLDKWNDSAGAADWQVDIDGTATNLSSALSKVAGVFFNVKDTAYGAVGDNTTDDTQAIKDAIAAATVSGGTVYFPAGTYRITAVIPVDADVNLLGAGPEISVIQMDSAANPNTLSFSIPTRGLQRVVGLGFGSSQANTGRHILLGDDCRILVEGCHFSGSTYANGYIDGSTNTPEVMIIKNNVFEPSAVNTPCIFSSSDYASIESNSFTLPDQYTTTVVTLKNGCVSNNGFDLFAATTLGANFVPIHAQNDSVHNRITVHGNHLGAIPTGNFIGVKVSDLTGVSANETSMIETANTWGEDYIHESLLVSDISSLDHQSNIHFGSRIGRTMYTARAAHHTVSPHLYEIETVKYTGAGGYNVSTTTLPPPGSRYILILINDAGGAMAANAFTTGFADQGNVTLGADHDVMALEFVSMPCYLTDESVELRMVEVSRTAVMQVAP